MDDNDSPARGDAKGRPGAARGNLIKRILGFSSLPFIAAVLPALALPFIARSASTPDWTALNTGFAVGAITASLGVVGWASLGTPLVAAVSSPKEKTELYARSFYIRLPAAILFSALSGAIAALISGGESSTVAAIYAVAATLGGMTLTWYAIGVSQVRIIVWYDIVPRSVATIAAVPLVALTGNVVWYGALLIIAVVAGLVGFHVDLFRSPVPPWPGRSRLLADVNDMKSAWGIETLGSIYANAPLPLATALAPTSAASAYASSDRLYRYGLLAVVALGNALQGWVLESQADRRRKNLLAIAMMALLGILGAAFLAILGTWFSGILFGADKAGDASIFAALAVAFFAISCSTPLNRNILLPARKEGALFLVSITSTFVGIGAMLWLGSIMGALGVAIGFAISESTTLVLCAILTVRTGLAGNVVSSRDHHPS